MADILVDTDVLVDHLRGHREIEVGHDVLHYSVVTRCELYAGSETDESRVDLLLAPFRELYIDRAISQRAGRLRRSSKIRTPDALIAATAIENRLVLVTRNRREFEAVRGLRMRSGPGS